MIISALQGLLVLSAESYDEFCALEKIAHKVNSGYSSSQSCKIDTMQRQLTFQLYTDGASQPFQAITAVGEFQTEVTIRT